MARIPQILSSPDRGVLPSSGGGRYVDAGAFGGGIGDAQIREGAAIQAGSAALGSALTGLGRAGGDIALQMREQDIKSGVANGVANYDFTKEYLNLQKDPNRDGLSYAENVSVAFDKSVTDYTDKITDDSIRRDVRERLIAQKPQFVTSAQGFEFREKEKADKLAADTGTTLQFNRVRADPQIDTYNDALAKTNAVIDARPNLTPATRELMKREAAEQLALRRFEGMIEKSSTDPDALNAIELELTAPNSPWKERMKSDSYDRVLDKVQTLKKAGVTGDVSAARAALQTVTERNTKGELIPPPEMAAIQDTVMKSKNPALLSQFAMIARAQQIYRDHQGLPLEQQRAKIEEMRKGKGVQGLPEPVRAGVVEGSAITGGTISVEYLAGLAGVEYGVYLNTGDYGRGPTGGGSDAVGVAQFTTPTWRRTLRANAAQLGINASASDAELDAMRKDPVMSMKAAAVHAADNKRILEAGLRRPADDVDLYFAHFLGSGGAVRFLSDAAQNPNGPATGSVDAAAVAANKGVFYDESGRVRTNAQVRSFISDKLMNNPSRVDYAGIQAGNLVLKNTVQALKDDPITFARQTERFGDVGEISSEPGMQRRGAVVARVAEYYRIPNSEVKPFTKDEAETMARTVRDGTADQVLGVMRQINALGNPDVIKAANRQIGEKDALFGYAASLSYAVPNATGTAADIIRGEKRIKEDPNVIKQIGLTADDLQVQFNGIVGRALAATPQGTTIFKAATAYYVERSMARGKAEPGRPDVQGFRDAVQAVMGAAPGQKAIDDINGTPTVLPPGTSADVFKTALRNMKDADYISLSVTGDPPRYTNGQTVSATEIARNGKFEAISSGNYRLRMADGYALAKAYRDGSSDFYVIRLDPQQVASYAARGQISVPATPPPMTHDGFPARQNPDGSHSTEVTITVTDPRINSGRATNIPSLWEGKEVSQDEAISRALKSGKSYQGYNSIDEAVTAARAKSARGGANAR